MTLYYILDGHTPVKVDDVLEWAKRFEKADRQVCVTEVGEALVSTVFLGLDHAFGVRHCCSRRWFSAGRWTRNKNGTRPGSTPRQDIGIGLRRSGSSRCRGR